MPKYDYRCSDCLVIFEMEHSMEDTMEWFDCPGGQEMCGGFLHKVFRPAATHFKGQDWGKVYRTWKSKGD